MKNKKLIIIIAVAIVAVLLIVLGVKFLTRETNDTLVGTWTTDGYTVYRFDKGGKGALVLSANEYPFTYRIKDKNKLSIDFKNKDAIDSDYEFSFEGKKLILKGINKTEGAFTFTEYKEDAKKA